MRDPQGRKTEPARSWPQENAGPPLQTMPLTEKQQADIRAAHARGARPNHQASGRVTLPLGKNTYAVLANRKGVSEAGQFYKTHAGASAGTHGLGADSIQRLNNGNNEYLMLRGGKKTLLRSLAPTGAWKYTAAGQRYFTTHELEEYVLHIPVKIETYDGRQRGREREDMLPFSRVGHSVLVSQIGTEAQRRQRAIDEAKATLDVQRSGDTIFDISGERYLLDDSTRAWDITTMATRRDPGAAPGARGTPVTTVTNGRVQDAQQPGQLAQRLGHRGQASQVPFPDDVLPEAWEEHGDRLCVPRQLARLLGYTFEDLCLDLDTFLDPSWRDEGVSSLEIMDFLKDKAIPYHCFAENEHRVYEPSQPQGPKVAWTAHGGHAFFYRHGACLQRHRPHDSTFKLKAEHESTTPPLSEWLLYDGEPAPGHYYCADLRAVRQQMIEAGKVPRLSLKSLGSWAALRYRCTLAIDGRSGWCIIRELSENHELMEAWAESVGVEYRGQGLPGLSQEVFTTLLRCKRRQPTLAQRREILLRQAGKCALCDEVTALEFDHQPPLRQLLAGQPQVFRGLCRPCHAEATEAQGGSVRLESRFNARAWREYVESPRAPPLVFQPEKPGCEEEVSCEIDVIRCRRSALTHPACAEFPVFCALDSVVPAVAGQLCDFSFVTGVRDRRKSPLALLPWVGPMWYARPSVEFLLHHGVISWQDISHSFQATGRVSSEVFRPVLDKMEEAWSEEARELGLPKRSVNCMVGLWAINESSEALSVVSGGIADGAGHWAKQEFSFDETVVHDWIHRVSLLDNSSMRPIHDFVMSTEHVAMANLRFVLARLKVPCTVLDCKTDAFNLKCASQSLAKIKQAVEAVRHKDLHQLLSPGGNLHGVTLFPRKGEEPVFKFRVEGTRLKGRFREPARDATCPAFEARLWADVGQEEAREMVLSGSSLLIIGPPGVGKSYWAASLCSQLVAEGSRVCIIAKTHASCANFSHHLTHFQTDSEGPQVKTADHWAHAFVRRGGCPFDVILIEEASMINSSLWNEIAKAAMLVKQWVVLGDFNQFGAIADTFCGSPVTRSVEDSYLLWDLCKGTRLRMTQNMRSDPQLFEFVLGVVGNPDLPGLLAAARAQFPLRPGPCRYSLAISHATRVLVNRRANLAETTQHSEAVYYNAQPVKGDNAPQSFWCWPGLELIGAGGRCKKGLFLRVVSCSAERITLEGDGGTLTLTPEVAMRCLRLTHCLTYASCQGLSLAGVRLLNTDSPHFGWKHLYVGASRCTSSRLLQVS